MGHKSNPIGLRLQINRTWDSRWFAGSREYGKLLHEDIAIREYLKKELKQAGVSKVLIERPHKKCRVTIQSARPGVVIGKKGADIDKIRKLVGKLTGSEVVINIVEVRKPETDAALVAESIAGDSVIGHADRSRIIPPGRGISTFWTSFALHWPVAQLFPRKDFSIR